ncbi:MAG TPA: ABC transporter substrate-binding protein [Nitrososphaerales archaeon]|nr:ABC transporter substrate-binding protein [Nitrososphaerales archaeon]
MGIARSVAAIIVVIVLVVAGAAAYLFANSGSTGTTTSSSSQTSSNVQATSSFQTTSSFQATSTSLQATSSSVASSSASSSGSSSSSNAPSTLVIDDAAWPYYNLNEIESTSWPNWFMYDVYQPLILVNDTALYDSGNIQSVPALAYNWTTPDSKTWTLNLLQNVTFSNGDQFNAYQAWFQIYSIYYLFGNSSAFLWGVSRDEHVTSGFRASHHFHDQPGRSAQSVYCRTKDHGEQFVAGLRYGAISDRISDAGTLYLLPGFASASGNG